MDVKRAHRVEKRNSLSEDEEMTCWPSKSGSADCNNSWDCDWLEKEIYQEESWKQSISERMQLNVLRVNLGLLHPRN